MGEWQPIASAPRGKIMVSDGKWFGGGAQQLIGANGPTGEWHLWNSFYSRHDGGECAPDLWLSDRPNCIRPTHWMPLIPPPVTPASADIAKTIAEKP